MRCSPEIQDLTTKSLMPAIAQALPYGRSREQKLIFYFRIKLKFSSTSQGTVGCANHIVKAL